jgi:ketosteroid isomerase-like protein
MRSTQEVLEHHLDRLGAGDLDGVLADYAPDVLLITPPGHFSPDGILRGTAGATLGFRALIGELGQPGVSFQMQHISIDGDYAYIVWRAETPDNSYDFGTDTFVVRNGRIVAQTFAAKIIPKAV